MKVTGLNGKGKGKLGAEVYSINHGVQIRREYNGEISNPSTDAQVGQRSRFKLASQLSAVLAPVIVFPRKGLQSPRNQFTKKNMPYFYGDVDGAQVTYENLQLAPGAVPLGNLIASRTSETNVLYFRLNGKPYTYVDKVLFCAFRKTEAGTLIYERSWVFDAAAATISGGYSIYTTDFVAVNEETYIFYAYGFRFNNDRARAKYGQYSVNSASDFAQLISNRTLSESDVTFTETRGVTLKATFSDSGSYVPGFYNLYLTATGGGKINLKIGTQQSETITNESYLVEGGESVTLAAVADVSQSDNLVFAGWYNNGEQQSFSQASSITITIDRQRDIIARFVSRNLE